MDRIYEAPDISKLMELLLPVKLEWENESYTIDQWRNKAVKEVSENRRQKKITIFNRFTSALLEGYRTRGKDYGSRIALMNRYFRDFTDITPDMIYQVLTENNYSLKNRGLGVILGAKRIVESYSFQWEQYFLEAEESFDSGYTDDEFLKIKGVGRKVRDFALSEFSTCFCAIDSHLADFIRRTGLLLYGYGQPDFGTSATENYQFLQRLIFEFSRESGWSRNSSKGYSPKEIDAMFWFFGNEKGICKGKPECSRCPLIGACLSFKLRLT